MRIYKKGFVTLALAALSVGRVCDETLRILSDDGRFELKRGRTTKLSVAGRG